MWPMLKSHRVIVCIGSGGVGKTTVAASLGLLAAREGLHVLVLTVDPAQRLATTLGLDKAEGEVHELTIPLKGKFSAALMNPQKTFDLFIKQMVKDPTLVEKIKSNKLYHELSTTLSGSQEFTGVEQLYAAYESGNYDLIILDTPPTKHAIDFFLAPQKIHALFQDFVLDWFSDPVGSRLGFFSNILHMGTKKVFSILEKLTGGEFINELTQFFSYIGSWKEQIQKHTIGVEKLLKSERTGFVLVTSFDEAKLKEAEYLKMQIENEGYHLRSIIINRAFPNWLQGEAKHFQQYYSQLKNYFYKKNTFYNEFEKHVGQSIQVLKVPELMQDVYQFEALSEMTEFLSGSGDLK